MSIDLVSAAESLFGAIPEPMTRALKSAERQISDDLAAAAAQIQAAEGTLAARTAEHAEAQQRAARLATAEAELLRQLSDSEAAAGNVGASIAERFAQAVVSGDQAAAAKALKVNSSDASAMGEAERIRLVLQNLAVQVAAAREAASAAEATLNKAKRELSAARCRQSQIAWDAAANLWAFAAGRLFATHEREVMICPEGMQLAALPFFSGDRAAIHHLGGGLKHPGRAAVASQHVTRDAWRYVQQSQS